MKINQRGYTSDALIYVYREKAISTINISFF